MAGPRQVMLRVLRAVLLSQVRLSGALVKETGWILRRGGGRANSVRRAAPVAEAETKKAPDAPFPSMIDGVELFTERELEATVEGRGKAFLFKARATVPGAVVLQAFDAIREKARTNLKEPGYRPGDVPPWIKTQLVEFSLTSLMEDIVKDSIETHGMAILDGDANEEMVKWIENPSEEAKSFVLGGPFTFHAAFNATVPLEAPESGGSTSLAKMYSITEAMENRAAKIYNDKGRVPGLVSTGGGGGGGAKKKSKSKKGGKKKR